MAEKKYLDSEKVIMLLRKDLICKYPSSFSFGLWAAADEIAKMDGEDVRPVVRGKWEVGGMFDDIGRCSCCHYMFPVDTAMTEFRFCPNCGADMREES